MTSMPDKPCPSFDPPIELRNWIYRILLGERLLVRHEEADGSAEGVKGPIHVRLFAVSQMMREEAMNYFFENHILATHVGDDGVVGALFLFIRRNSEGRKLWPLEKIKRVEVSVGIHKSIQISFLAPSLDRVCDVLAECTQLVQVRITPTCPTRSHNAQLDTDMDGLLKSFARVKGDNCFVRPENPIRDVRQPYGRESGAKTAGSAAHDKPGLRKLFSGGAVSGGDSRMYSALRVSSSSELWRKCLLLR